jgi:hypothetical protein
LVIKKENQFIFKMSSEKKVIEQEPRDTRKKEDLDIKIPTCPICCEMYTKTLRKEIKCSYCSYACCAVCFKLYMFSNMAEPNCMSCRKRLPREVIYDNFSKKFINGEYKTHRENMLVEREMAMMPSTQNILELKNQIDNLNRNSYEIDTKIQELEQEKSVINQTIFNYNQIYNNPALYYVQNSIAKKQASQFIKPCPAKDCRGFLSTKYNCGVCGTKVCPHCHEIKPKREKNDKDEKQEHKCDPANVESVKLIKSETKPCPKCACPIFKLEGCSQMWCTECKTAWDWNSGQIINGVIHNPHYFEYLRSIGREDDEIRNRFEENHQGIQCLGWEQLRLMAANFSTFPRFNNFVNDIWSISRQINHIRDYVLNRIVTLTYNIPEQVNADLRVAYLKNIMSKDDLKIKIQRRDKKHIFNQNLREVIQMYSDVLSDLLRNFANKVLPLPNNYNDLKTNTILHNELIEEIVKLNTYTRNSVRKILNDFNYSSVPDFIFEPTSTIIKM